MKKVRNIWKAGDVLVVESRNTSATPRTGEILDVLGDASHPHFSVRWDDGHETIFYPSQDVTLRHTHVHR
jgi:rRNA processing protein Gar1